MNQNTDIAHEAKKLRLLAAALELQHFTSAAAHVVPIPGTDHVIAIGAPAQVRALLADTPSVSEQDERALPPLPRPMVSTRHGTPCYTVGQMMDYARAALAAHPAPQAAPAQPGAHHLEPENITAVIVDLRAIEDGTTEHPVMDRDWRTWAGVLHRIISYLAERRAQVPVAQAARDVLAERRRQVEVEGMTNEDDDRYHAAELPRAAAAYILNGANDEAPYIWPWAKSWWKPRDARANYVRAAALLLAEIERIDRAQEGGAS